MRYKVGDKVVLTSKEVEGDFMGSMRKYFGDVVTIKTECEHSNYLYKYTVQENEWFWYDHMIDHEATAKLTLPQPSKDMLISGMKVVYRNGSVGYVLVEVGKIYKETGEMDGSLKNLDSCLKWRGTTSFDIIQIWDGDTLIAQRTEKSEAKLKKESLEKQISECSDKIKNLHVCIENLELEIKSL